MRWQGRRGSRNIEDRRRMSGGAIGGVGGVGVLAIVVIGWFLGVDLTPMLQDPAITGGGGGGEVTAEDEEAAQFVSVTLADTEEVWARLFDEQVGEAYRPATLVLFKGVTQSSCGGATAATGPFYCPGDEKVYLDTDFFTLLKRQLGAGGDFAAAYVVAHEIGHHVQDELGVLSETTAMRQRASEADANAISVRVELQADCLAGIWAQAARDQFGSLEPGDVEEAMNAAARIGDDTLQRNAGRVPMPETFTHGTSAERQRWFTTGYQSGRIADCDTFGSDRL